MKSSASVVSVQLRRCCPTRCEMCIKMYDAVKKHFAHGQEPVPQQQASCCRLTERVMRGMKVVFVFPFALAHTGVL